MIKTAGVPFDIFDDPQGVVLRRKIPDPATLPTFLKEASIPSREEIDSLPDSAFALVMYNGGGKLRKFAHVSKALTALNTIYFLESKDLLPKNAQKIAAVRLCQACLGDGLEPPESLRKMCGVAAQEKRAWIVTPQGSVVDLAQRRGAYAPPGDRSPSPTYTELSAGTSLEEEAASFDAQQHVNELHSLEIDADEAHLRQTFGGLVGEIRAYLQSLPNNPIGRSSDDSAPRSDDSAGSAPRVDLYRLTADLRAKGVPASWDAFLNIMSSSTLYPHLVEIGEVGKAISQRREQLDEDGMNATAKDLDAKLFALLLLNVPLSEPGPEVDVTNEEATPKMAYQPAARPEDYLLSDTASGISRYPVRTAQEAKTAAAYFMHNWRGLAPAERRTYCVHLMEKAAGFDVEKDMPPEVAKYGASEIDPFRAVYFDLRTLSLPDDELVGKEVYRQLEKRAEFLYLPEAVAALAEVDARFGLDRFYDDGIPDPFYSLIGSSKLGQARVADCWAWQGPLGDSIIEDQLLQAMQDSAKKKLVEQVFGAEFFSSLAKSPVAVFDSLPVPLKESLSRLLA